MNYRRIRFTRGRQARKGFDGAQRRRLQKRCQLLQSLTPVPPTFTQLSSHEFLLQVASQQRDTAPGPDGVRWSEIGRSELAALARQLRQYLWEESWLPSRARITRIPKDPDGKKFRTLKLRSIATRWMGAALNTLLEPYLEKVWLNGVHGFRRQRSPLTVFLAMEGAIRQGLTVIAQDDIYHAFDVVNVKDVMTAFRHYLSDPRLLSLIETLLLGNPATNRGLDQGGPLSPTALNLLLHVFLDAPVQEQAATPLWVRYADNVLYACQSVTEGTAALQQAQQLLGTIGLRLKGEDGEPTDLRHRAVTVLGLGLRGEGEQVRYDLGETCWQELEQVLLECHHLSDPPRAAREAVRGWIGWHGPALEGRETVVTEGVLEALPRYGFRETTRKDVLGWCQSSRDRWSALRDRELTREPGDPSPLPLIRRPASPTADTTVCDNGVMGEAAPTGFCPGGPAPF